MFPFGLILQMQPSKPFNEMNNGAAREMVQYGCDLSFFDLIDSYDPTLAFQPYAPHINTENNDNETFSQNQLPLEFTCL